MMPDLNDGERADLLTLGRRHTGELDGEVPAVFAQRIARSEAALPALDIGALRDRAEALDERGGPRAQGRRPWAWMALPLAAAATAVLFLQPATPDTREKGGGVVSACEGCSPGALDGWVRRDGEALPIRADTVVRPGDAVRFAIPDSGRSSVVVFNVDGTGTPTRFWPAAVGAPPVPLAHGAPTLLEGSVRLDDAAGPEAFVAVFDAPDVAGARGRLDAAWADGGLAGLERAAQGDDIALIVLSKEAAP
jgi:hypothetical protein